MRAFELSSPLKLVKYERGDLRLSSKWSNEFLGSKFEKLLKFVNRWKSERKFSKICEIRPKTREVMDIKFFFCGIRKIIKNNDFTCVLDETWKSGYVMTAKIGVLGPAGPRLGPWGLNESPGSPLSFFLVLYFFCISKARKGSRIVNIAKITKIGC